MVKAAQRHKETWNRSLSGQAGQQRWCKGHVPRLHSTAPNGLRWGCILPMAAEGRAVLQAVLQAVHAAAGRLCARSAHPARPAGRAAVQGSDGPWPQCPQTQCSEPKPQYWCVCCCLQLVGGSTHRVVLRTETAHCWEAVFIYFILEEFTCLSKSITSGF